MNNSPDATKSQAKTSKTPKKQQSSVLMKRKRDSDPVIVNLEGTPKNENDPSSNKRQKTAGPGRDLGGSARTTNTPHDGKQRSSAPLSDAEALNVLLGFSLACSKGTESPKEDPPVVVKKKFCFAGTIDVSRYYDWDEQPVNVLFCTKRYDYKQLLVVKYGCGGKFLESVKPMPSIRSAGKAADTDKAKAVKPLVGILKVPTTPTAPGPK